jgi:uncharacterized LabA/DUF88 family protein/cold shock CspA family protein
MPDNKTLTRIGVYYDGNYFLHVSNYYAYQHERASRISISGLHQFIRRHVADLLGADYALCPVVDAHYFRGRLPAYELKEGNRLFAERQFEDVLMQEGVITHYTAIRSQRSGKRTEKGIDVWLALEAYQNAINNSYDIICLIASDGDYVPLARKLNGVGKKVMLLSWDLEYTDEMGNARETRTSQDLLEEVSYPVHMHEVIENRIRKNDPMINSLFIGRDVAQRYQQALAQNEIRRPGVDIDDYEEPDPSDLITSTIFAIHAGYGFVVHPPNNLFFHVTDLAPDTDFAVLQPGDLVEFTVGQNDRGPCARHVRRIQGA